MNEVNESTKVAAYRDAVHEWEVAIVAGRPHEVVNARWEVVRMWADRLDVTPGVVL